MENTKTEPRYAGQLDPEFTQIAEIPGWVDILRALDWPAVRDLFFSSVAPLSDGRLYASGYFAETVNHPVEYFIVRLQTDGQRDTSFGSDGVIRGTFPVNFKMIIPTKISVQDDGKILMQALGYAGSLERPDPVLLVARFLESGEADLAFGEQGLMRKNLDAERHNFLAAFVGDLQQMPDGRILATHTSLSAAGGPLKEGAILYRITPEGELDTSFNASGLVELAVADASLRVVGFVIQPDGRIVVAGQIRSLEGGFARGVLARLSTEGQLDETFGPLGTGFYEFSLEGHDLEVSTVAMRPDGSLVCAGTTVAPSKSQNFIGQGFIIGMTADGLADTQFNNGQLLMTPVSERYSAHWVSAQFQPDGKLLLAGRSNRLASTYDAYIYLARYQSDGTPDITFGQAQTGRVETHVGGFNDVPIELQQQADGRIVVGANASSFRKGTLLRYLND